MAREKKFGFQIMKPSSRLLCVRSNDWIRPIVSMLSGRAIRQPLESSGSVPSTAIVSARKLADALKERARQVGQPQQSTSNGATDALSSAGAQTTGSYLIPKEKRVRDPAHLAFVASQPCLICGRRPAQAHHLRFAQPRAMAMKVSDEFTVPVCNTHHDQLHRSWR